MINPSTSHHTLLKSAMLLAAFVALLSACGGGGGDDNAAIATGTSNGNGSLNGPNDPFASQVSKVLDADENGAEIDAQTVALTVSDTTEPIGL